jgi:hypothetical protein
MASLIPKRPLFDTSRYSTASSICSFLESGEQSVFYEHTKNAPPDKMTGNDELDRKKRDAGVPRKSGEVLPDPAAVGVGICVYDISDIDSRSGHFFGHYRLMLKWRVPDLQVMLDELGIKRDSDRTPIPLNVDDWKTVTKSEVVGYREFAKKLTVPSFALNTLGGDPLITQRYAYVAETTDYPDIVTMQLVFHGKFKVMEANSIASYPFDKAKLDFKIRLWDNKRDGARFFQPLRFPDGTHFLYPLKMNIMLSDWYLFLPALRLYRQGGMKGENATGPSVYSVSLIAKRRPFNAFGKVALVNGMLTSALLLVGGTHFKHTTREGVVLLICGLKALSFYKEMSSRFDMPVADIYAVTSLSSVVFYAAEILGSGTTIGSNVALISLASDALFCGIAKAVEYAYSTAPTRFPASTWKEEMGRDFDSSKVTFQ